jgi:nitroreductase
MSELIKEIVERRAKRALSEEKIPAETLARIMTAATFAPSCINSQSWRFLVATDDQALAKMREALAGGNYWAKKAPVLAAVVTKIDFDCRLSDGRDYAFFDCGLATQNLLLQATKEGLYAHPMAGFDPFVVKKAFDIPAEFTVITLVAIGYPGSDAHLSEKHLKSETGPRERKSESEVICYNEWDF